MDATLPALGPVGLWAPGLDLVPVADAAAAAAEAEELGFGALWLSEGLVRDPFVQAAGLLAATRSLVVGTGIAVIWGRHPRMVRAMARGLRDAHPDRFVLGLGTSHADVVVGVPEPEARSRARRHVAGYLAGGPYRASLRRLGFSDDDLADGCSDALVDALVAIGEEQVADRVTAHLRAGADHVCLQALPAQVGATPVDQWRRLAAAVETNGTLVG